MIAGESALGRARADPEPVEGSKGKTPAPGTEPCVVYILRCSDGGFSVGAATNPQDRERLHHEGRGAKYTAGRRPVRVVYAQPHQSRSAAQVRKAQIARWTRAKKDALVAGNRSNLHERARFRVACLGLADSGAEVDREAHARSWSACHRDTALAVGTCVWAITGSATQAIARTSEGRQCCTERMTGPVTFICVCESGGPHGMAAGRRLQDARG